MPIRLNGTHSVQLTIHNYTSAIETCVFLKLIDATPCGALMKIWSNMQPDIHLSDISHAPEQKSPIKRHVKPPPTKPPLRHHKPSPSQAAIDSPPQKYAASPSMKSPLHNLPSNPPRLPSPPYLPPLPTLLEVRLLIDTIRFQASEIRDLGAFWVMQI